MAKSKSSRAIPQPLTPSKEMSMQVRKIENGFIVSQSGYVKHGKTEKYVSKEFFSKTNPIEIRPEAKMKFGGKK